MTDPPKQPTRVWKAARELGMTRVSVYRLIHNGTFKLEPWEGRTFRITRESIEAYKALRTVRIQEVLNEKEVVEITVKEIRATIARNKAIEESSHIEAEREEAIEVPTSEPLTAEHLSKQMLQQLWDSAKTSTREVINDATGL